ECGLVIAQDPMTAKFDGMPKSVIGTGLADYVLTIEQMALELIKNVKQTKLSEEKVSPELNQIFKLLHAHTGHDFSFYKINTIYRRIEKQMHLHHMHSLSQYVKFLRLHPHEITTLFKD